MRKNMQLRCVEHAGARVQEHATQPRAASEPPVNIDYVPNGSGRFRPSPALGSALGRRAAAVNRAAHAPQASKQNNEDVRMVELSCSMPAFDRLITAVNKAKQRTET